MHRSGRHCFWLRLAVIAAAAAFVKANAQEVVPPAAERAAAERSSSARGMPLPSEEAAEAQGHDSKQDSEQPLGGDRTGGPGAGFIALRPEVQDLNGASIRRLCPREPVSGLHQPVVTPQTAQHSAMAFEAERPTEPDLLRTAARPIVRHGPPNA